MMPSEPSIRLFVAYDTIGAGKSDGSTGPDAQAGAVALVAMESIQRGLCCRVKTMFCAKGHRQCSGPGLR